MRQELDARLMEGLSSGPFALRVDRLAKRFTLHLSGPTILDALGPVSLSVSPGFCLGLTGPSGSGKSTLLRCLYGNYRITSGEAVIRHLGSPVRMSEAPDRLIVEMRTHTIGHVSQFLRAIPRVPAIEVVAETLVSGGAHPAAAKEAAGDMLMRLNGHKINSPCVSIVF